jgi:hypothetical protein
MYSKFSDEERGMFLLQLEVLDYPKNEHALLEISKRPGAPSRKTLRRWWKEKDASPGGKIARHKKGDVVESLMELLHLHIGAAMEAVQGSEDIRALDVGIGILVDKIQLLTGQPTWRGEIIDLLKQGTITPGDVLEELGDELATELFVAAGVSGA